jgi:hypothetical protein
METIEEKKNAAVKIGNEDEDRHFLANHQRNYGKNVKKKRGILLDNKDEILENLENNFYEYANVVIPRTGTRNYQQNENIMFSSDFNSGNNNEFEIDTNKIPSQYSLENEEEQIYYQEKNEDKEENGTFE